jgi:hypothetical protein
MPHIRIFPHSTEEFRSLDLLTTWLLTALKARDGMYRLRSANAVADLKPGSIVLFRHGDVVVGEAVVRAYVREHGTDRILTGEEQQYEAVVKFAPDSIRLFAPPVSVQELQQLIGEAPDISVPRGYYAVRNWDVYPKLLAAHVGRTGAFV